MTPIYFIFQPAGHFPDGERMEGDLEGGCSASNQGRHNEKIPVCCVTWVVEKAIFYFAQRMHDRLNFIIDNNMQ
jgi:hypothetical protein